MTNITQAQFDTYLARITNSSTLPLTVEQIFTELGVTIRPEFTDGQVVRSGDPVDAARRTWYVRQAGAWNELSIRADSQTRTWTDQEIYDWIDSGDLVLWQQEATADDNNWDV